MFATFYNILVNIGKGKQKIIHYVAIYFKGFGEQSSNYCHTLITVLA